MTSAGRRHRLVVVGDVVLDRDLLGTCERLCPDAPVPVVDVGEVRERPGGAGLTALLCRADDLEVTLVAPLAADAGRAAAAPACSPGPGSTSSRWPAAAARGARRGSAARASRCCDWTTADPAPRARPARARRRGHRGGGRRPRLGLRRAARTAYPALREALGRASARRPVVWDPHPRGATPVAGCALVTPNLAEARAASGDPVGTPDVVAAALVRRWAARAVAVTAGEQGAWLSTSADEPLVRGGARGARRATPAGQATGSAATAALALARGSVPSRGGRRGRGRGLGVGGRRWRRGLPPPLPVRPSRPARVGAGRPEPRRPRRDGATRRPPSWPPPCAGTAARWWPPAAASTCCTPGTSRSLEAAARLGDGLVVLLNSDASVRRLKGPDRPVAAGGGPGPGAAGRCAASTPSSSSTRTTPRTVLDRLRPDIWAKGGDYDASCLPEAGRWSAAGAAGSSCCPTWPAGPPPRSSTPRHERQDRHGHGDESWAPSRHRRRAAGWAPRSSRRSSKAGGTPGRHRPGRARATGSRTWRRTCPTPGPPRRRCEPSSPRSGRLARWSPPPAPTPAGRWPR